jgi:hypothetical protein
MTYPLLIMLLTAGSTVVGGLVGLALAIAVERITGFHAR